MTNSTSGVDRIYAQAQKNLVDFAFDEAVSDVFADMIRRSVPGYETILTMLGVFADTYLADESARVYDLGCSHGAATLALAALNPSTTTTYHLVDNSSAMLARCADTLTPLLPQAKLEFIAADISAVTIVDADMVVLNFTLQFVDPALRNETLARIYQGMKPGACLLVSEKINSTAQIDNLHRRFKAANGYSELEISQKRSALEKVMILDSADSLNQRLLETGFSHVEQWFQCFNFISLLAVK